MRDQTKGDTMEKMVTTGFSNFTQDGDVLLTGTEQYPISGTVVTSDEVTEILKRYKGLKTYWDCIRKAEIAVEVLKRGEVVFGSLMVTSGDYQSEYGYYFNPPLELHAWVDLGNGIIFDAALPGVIAKGLNTYDNIGAYLIKRKPIVLAGKPLKWTRYKSCQRKEK